MHQKKEKRKKLRTNYKSLKCGSEVTHSHFNIWKSHLWLKIITFMVSIAFMFVITCMSYTEHWRTMALVNVFDMVFCLPHWLFLTCCIWANKFISLNIISIHQRLERLWIHHAQLTYRVVGRFSSINLDLYYLCWRGQRSHHCHRRSRIENFVRPTSSARLHWLVLVPFVVCSWGQRSFDVITFQSV